MPKENEALEIIRSSGNSFHVSVIRALRDHGWSVLISPYYLDASTNKARELDLIAERSWPVYLRSSDPIGHVRFRMFIECKYMAAPIVFWFDKRNDPAARKWLEVKAGLPRNNTYSDRHHYLSGSGEVAKLFASKSGSAEGDPIFKALNQCLSGIVYLRKAASHLPLDLAKMHLRDRTVDLPVIVCNSFSKTYGVDIGKEGPVRNIDDSFQLEVEYAYVESGGESAKEYFLVDFVALDKLPLFLAALDADREAISALF